MKQSVTRRRFAAGTAAVFAASHRQSAREGGANIEVKFA